MTAIQSLSPRVSPLGSRRVLADMTIHSDCPCSVGIGLKPQHYADVLESVSASSRVPRPRWVEVHPQNYFCDGGPPHRWLGEIVQHLPISFHSVGLSLGTASGHNRNELEQLARLCDRYNSACVSDHLSWSGTASNRYPDLLPVPYTDVALDHFVAQVSAVQDRLRRKILIENPSRYLAFAGDEMDEIDFLHLLCERAGCGILFDVNNVEVSATNLGFDPFAFIDDLDPRLVGEIHLAGHAIEAHEQGAFLIDDHGSPVTDVTWALFERFIARAGPKPVLIEWDTDVPPYNILMEEAEKATKIMDAAQASRSVGTHHAIV